METLGKLDPAVLATHAPAIVAKLDDCADSDAGVRRAAMETLGKLSLEPAVLAKYAQAIIDRLEDVHEGMRMATVETLRKLEPDPEINLHDIVAKYDTMGAGRRLYGYLWILRAEIPVVLVFRMVSGIAFPEVREFI